MRKTIEKILKEIYEDENIMLGATLVNIAKENARVASTRKGKLDKTEYYLRLEKFIELMLETRR